MKGAQELNNGFQAGARKTVPVSLSVSAAFLFEEVGLCIWLGRCEGAIAPGTKFKNSDGTEGAIILYKPLSHLRMTWKKSEWNFFSTLQLRLFKAVGGTTISFYQDKLQNKFQQDEMSKRWQDVLVVIGSKLVAS